MAREIGSNEDGENSWSNQAEAQQMARIIGITKRRHGR